MTLTNRHFSLLLLTLFVSCLLCAAPGLHRTYTEITKKPEKVSPPVLLLTKNFSWGDGTKTTLLIECKIILTSIEGPAKAEKSNQRKVFISAKITNSQSQPVEISSISLLLSMHDVELLDNPIHSFTPISLASNESKTIQSTAFIDRELLVGVIDDKIDVSAKAAFK